MEHVIVDEAQDLLPVHRVYVIPQNLGRQSHWQEIPLSVSIWTVVLGIGRN